MILGCRPPTNALNVQLVSIVAAPADLPLLVNAPKVTIAKQVPSLCVQKSALLARIVPRALSGQPNVQLVIIQT